MALYLSGFYTPESQPGGGRFLLLFSVVVVVVVVVVLSLFHAHPIQVRLEGTKQRRTFSSPVQRVFVRTYVLSYESTIERETGLHRLPSCSSMLHPPCSHCPS